jgi:hypothetical protein
MAHFPAQISLVSVKFHSFFWSMWQKEFDTSCHVIQKLLHLFRAFLIKVDGHVGDVRKSKMDLDFNEIYTKDSSDHSLFGNYIFDVGYVDKLKNTDCQVALVIF